MQCHGLYERRLANSICVGESNFWRGMRSVATETRGDEFHITATFTNTSDRAIGNPFFEVTDLTGDNVLVNGDAGPGGTGATLSPDVGDGILSPGESTTVTFVVGLASHEAFSFYVSVKGDPGA